MPDSRLAHATRSEIRIAAPKGRVLSPDAIRDAFNRDPGYDILDYVVETKGILALRVKSITLIVAAKVDNAGDPQDD